MSFIILIPAYKPEHRLVQLVEQLLAASPAQIVVVNDGSPADYDLIFATLAQLPRVQILVHAVNQGKGAALRTGFRHIETLPVDISCVVTADADGQHSVKDILAVGATGDSHPEAMVIGGRRFDKDVPARSMFGNTVTRWVMRLFFGIRLWDTQTGLRGIPHRLLPALMEIPFSRYDLEIEMLLVAHRKGVPLIEIPIETIYIESNRGSHYKPVRDSGRVYFVLFRHFLGRLVTALADFLAFILAHALSQHIPLSMLLARLISIPVYYYLLRKWALAPHAKGNQVFIRFALIAVFAGAITTWLIPIIICWLSVTPLQAKLIIEVCLYILIILGIKGLNRIKSAAI
mgnify:CR=1 FL=1